MATIFRSSSFKLTAYVGNFHQALDKYRQTHEKFPESREVLKYLIRLCTDMNMEKDLEEYNRKLKKLDKLLKEREMRDDRVGSASTSGTFVGCGFD